MKKYRILILITLSLAIISCGGEGESNSNQSQSSANKEPVEAAKTEIPASERITLDNKGVGRIKNVTLDPVIDAEMAARGEQLFNTNCTACHKIDKRFIGPSPKGIMQRRSPEWIMNMILDPQLMVEQDQCAKDLLIEYNGAAMANQNMTEEQARDILEYFRTL